MDKRLLHEQMKIFHGLDEGLDVDSPRGCVSVIVTGTESSNFRKFDIIVDCG